MYVTAPKPVTAWSPPVSLRSSVGNQLYLLEVKPQPLTNPALQIESGEGIPFPLEAARYGEGAVSHPKEICIFFQPFLQQDNVRLKNCASNSTVRNS